VTDTSELDSGESGKLHAEMHHCLQSQRSGWSQLSCMHGFATTLLCPAGFLARFHCCCILQRSSSCSSPCRHKPTTKRSVWRTY
jgi:hypothetical protein